MPYEMQIDGIGGVADLDVYWAFVSIQDSKTSAQVEVYVGNTAAVGSYGYEIVPIANSFTGTYTAATITFTGTGFVRFNISPLTSGTTYKMRTIAYSGAGLTGSNGIVLRTDFMVPQSTKAGSVVETVPDRARSASEEFDILTGMAYASSSDEIDEITKKIGTQAAQAAASRSTRTVEKTTRSLFKLSNNNKKKDNYSVAYKSYSSLLTNKTYYAFGTSLFFKPTLDNPIQSGGLAFFVDNAGTTGYVIQISTSASAGVNSSQEFKILKIKNERMVELEDSQTVNSKSLGGIYGGRTYKIDVRVKVNPTSVEIYCYVNGFKITAVDSNPTGSVQTTDPTKILTPTNKVAMICNKGTVYFDYIYGMHLTEEQYKQEELFNIYEGQYSEAAISFLYGNKTLQNNTVSNSFTNGFIEEFGAVARELRVLKTKYNKRPAFPLYASTGLNSFARIIGQRLTSSGAEVYVINNSGTYIPLDDAQFYSFYILGKHIVPSGVLEYVENSASEYSVQEPVIFESKWIQEETDVANLAKWIKDIWSNKQTIITLEVFANPLLSVGDIITVTYPYNNLSTSNKFVITNINHEFREGLRTTITARTL